PNAYAEQWNTAQLKEEIKRIFDLDLPVDGWAAEEGIADQEIAERLIKAVDDKAKATELEIGRNVLGKYDGAKAMLAFVEADSRLAALLSEPGDNLEAIGRTLLAANPGLIRINGGTPPQAVHATQIGYQFYRQHSEAREIVADIESAGDRSAEA